MKAIEAGRLAKNDKGQWMEAGVALPTCVCGKFMDPMSPCIVKMLGGTVGGVPTPAGEVHKFIQ
jgi:hypothetical protein